MRPNFFQRLSGNMFASTRATTAQIPFETSFTVATLLQEVYRISISTNWLLAIFLTHSLCSLWLGLTLTLDLNTLSPANLNWKQCRLRRPWSIKFWQTIYLRPCLPRNALFNLTSLLFLLSLMFGFQILLQQSLLPVANCLMASPDRIQTIHILAAHLPRSTVALLLQLNK